MYCKNCGKELPQGAKYCIHCGTKAEQPSSTVNWTFGGCHNDYAPPRSAPTKKRNELPSWFWVFILCVVPLWVIFSIIPTNQDSAEPTINETQPTVEAKDSNTYDPDDRILYIYYAHKFVRDQLSSPLTAIFTTYGNHEVTGKDNLVCVKGHVNAQNKFGVFIKNNFIVQFTIEDRYYHCTYMKLGNSTVGTYVTIE